MGVSPVQPRVQVVQGLKSLRENQASFASVVRNTTVQPPTAAIFINPARKHWVKWEIEPVPSGTTLVLTHTLKGRVNPVK